MNRNSIIYFALIIVIILFAGVNQSYKSENVDLKIEINELNESLIEVLNEKAEINNEFDLYIKDSEVKVLQLEEADLALEEEFKKLLNDNKNLFESLTYYENYHYVLNDIIKSQVDIISTTDNKSLLAIQSFSAHDYSQYTNYYIPYGDVLIDNLKLVASNLSKNNFTDMPMEIIGIEVIDDKEIALINIYETDDSPRSWIRHYFQGSTGGYITNAILVESFLQRETKLVNWIDGVMFTYNGKRGMMGDHIEGLFEMVYYRDVDYFNYDEQ